MMLKQMIFAFISSMGFAILYSIPKDSILRSGFVGAMGWMVYYKFSHILNDNIISTFFAAVTVGVLGELFARYYKKPATIFMIPGIIPLVPGAAMYYTMLSLVEKDFNMAANKGTEAFFVAAAISIGLIISTTLSRSIKRVKNKG